MKKASLTIFFIFGILLVVISLLFWFNTKNIEVENYAREVKDFQKEKESFESYSNGCLKAATEKTIERYGLSYIGEQMETSIWKRFLECMNDFDDFKERGFDISYDEGTVNLTVNEKKIKTELTMNLVFEKGDEKTSFEKFNSDIALPDDFKDPIKGEWLYRGVLYDYEYRTTPRPMSIHIAKIDLEDPTIRFFVTPRIAPGVMTSSSFLSQYNVQLATNGGLFDIGGTNEVSGYAMSKEEVYSSPEIKPDVTFFIGKDKSLSMQKRIPDLEYAVTGQNRVVQDHAIFERLYPNHPLHKDSYDNLQPVTAFGIDEKNNWLIIIVIDGRQPGFSEGIKLIELAGIFLENNADIAINMDGGGSSTIVTQDRGVLNKPSDGHERPVANHFGVIAERLKV